MRYQIVYWRDIPTQVRGKNGRKRASQMLPDRFQKVAYRAAFRAKAINGPEYAESFRHGDWVTATNEEAESLDAVLAAVAVELDQAYSDDQLNQLALQKGYAEQQQEN